jgi:hypothetical protein
MQSVRPPAAERHCLRTIAAVVEALRFKAHR